MFGIKIPKYIKYDKVLECKHVHIKHPEFEKFWYIFSQNFSSDFKIVLNVLSLYKCKCSLVRLSEMISLAFLEVGL